MELGGEVHRESSGAGTDGIEALTTTLVMLAGLVGYLRKEFVVEFNGWPEFAPEAFLRKVELGSS